MADPFDELAAKIRSKKATDITGAAAKIRDLARKGDIARLLPLLEEAARDKRPTVATALAQRLREIAAISRRRDTLRALWEAARAGKLATVAAALTPPDQMSTDTPVGAAQRHLARGEAKPVRRLLAGAAAREVAGVVHAEAARADPGTVAAAVVDAVAADDEVVRFAAVDALAIAGERGGDLTPHVDALVALLDVEGQPALAPNSGGWRTAGLADSAARALGHAVRHDGSHRAARAALERASRSRKKKVARRAGLALATGLQARGDRTAVAAAGLDVAAIAAGLRADRARARQRAAHELRAVAADPAAIAAIADALTDGLGTDVRPRVLELLETAGQAGLDLTPWVPLLGGVLLDGDHARASRPVAIRCLRLAASRGVELGPSARLLP